MDPYLTLDVLDDSDDATIKTAYLQAVKRYPPDQNGELFEQIRNAYEQIATKEKRMMLKLFNIEPVLPVQIIKMCIKNKGDQPLTTETLQKIIASGLQSSLTKMKE